MGAAKVVKRGVQVESILQPISSMHVDGSGTSVNEASNTS